MPPRAGRTQVLLSNAAGHPVLLDLATGRTTKPDSHTDTWCRDQTNYRLTTPYRAGRNSLHDYIGQDVIYRCDARGHRSANPAHPSTNLAQALAAAAGQLAWSSSTGVLAVPAA
jgi:hypothetical protein